MRRRPLLALLVAAALGAAACGDNAEPEKADRISTTSTTSSSPTSEVDADAAAALEVWREYTVVSQEWRNPPDPAHPRIAEFIATGAVEDFRASVATELARNVGRRPGPAGLPDHVTEVQEATASRVVLRDCFVDDFVAFDTDTGEVIDDAVATRTLEIELVNESQTWKIQRISELDRKSGRVRCDA